MRLAASAVMARWRHLAARGTAATLDGDCRRANATFGLQDENALMKRDIKTEADGDSMRPVLFAICCGGMHRFGVSEMIRLNMQHASAA